MGFEEEHHVVNESLEDHFIEVKVNRWNGSTGKISCHYATEPETALSPNDYDDVEDDLVLEHGTMSGIIKINIKARGRYEGSEHFRLILTNPTGGARFDGQTDGGTDSEICTIEIRPDKNAKEAVDKMSGLLQMNWD